jgi:uncharacterized Tic20 family protein
LNGYNSLVISDGVAKPRPAGDRAWAAFSYVCAPVATILGPLAIYLGSRRRSDFLREHTAQALNLWLTIAIYCIAPLALIPVSGLAWLVAMLVALVPAMLAVLYALVAAVRASQGRFFDVPGLFCFRMVRLAVPDACQNCSVKTVIHGY